MQNVGPSRELLDARSEYGRATRSSATAAAPQSLERARVTLQAAEQAHQNNPRSVRERDLAFMAKRRAQAAIADGNAAVARRSAELARAELRRTTEDAARNAEVARAQAEAARAQARAATQQAQTETEKRQAAEQARQAAEQAAQTAQTSREQADAARVEAERTRDQAMEAMRKLGDVAEQDQGVVLTLPGEVMFRHGRATLLPRAKEKLDALAEALQHLEPDQRFIIEGHTDSTGSDRANRRLSRARAMAVREYLTEHGVDPDRIEAVGRGEDEPVATNDNPEGRANNRRVEIVVTPPAVTRR